MAFIVKPDRRYTFKLEYQKDEWVEVTFDFPMSEDLDYKKMRVALKDVSKADYEKQVTSAIKKVKAGGDYELTDKEFLSARASGKLHTQMLRLALVDWKGFNLPDGTAVKVSDKSGHIIEQHQKAIFNDFIMGREELLEKINMAYGGELSEKNSVLGLPESSNLDGVQANAAIATSKESARDANTSKE